MANPIHVNEVFADADPSYTFIDRSDTPEYRRIQNVLLGGGKIVLLHGPSKSGKTLLCRQIFTNRDPVIIYGSQIDSKGRFWDLVADEVRLAVPECAKYLGAQKRPVLIDDFHWVPKNVQAPLLKSLKPILDYGGTVVLLSVPDLAEVFLAQTRGGRPDPILGELLGKSLREKSPLWGEGQIKKIARDGFPVLKAKVPDATVQVLARFSFSNPMLMQKHCAELCHQLGFDFANAKLVEYVVTAEHLVNAFKEVASSMGTFFDVIVRKHGPKLYTLNTGATVTLRELAVMGVVKLNMNTKIGAPRVMKNIKSLLATNSAVPPRAEVQEAFNQLITEMRDVGQSGLVVDTNGFLYIAHPFFKSYLVWSFAPDMGLGVPDLDKYVEPPDDDE